MVRARGLDVLKTIENSKTPEGGNYVPFGRLAIHTIFGGLLYVNDSAMTVHEKHVRHATELRRVLAKLALYRSIGDALHAPGTQHDVARAPSCALQVALDGFNARCGRRLHLPQLPVNQRVCRGRIGLVALLDELNVKPCASERLRCSLLVRPYVGIAGNDDLSDFRVIGKKVCPF